MSAVSTHERNGNEQLLVHLLFPLFVSLSFYLFYLCVQWNFCPALGSTSLHSCYKFAFALSLFLSFAANLHPTTTNLLFLVINYGDERLRSLKIEFLNCFRLHLGPV
ncbi:hypothetical protein NE237_023229 [Protea cynaroides]|uniref:Uncharacterized protein n=1 Tax=Protea cynaroides TaxID=273540 RepID=A0A9Q0K601_9MAGN|nr:hypothetical protein NE237_023229 [Protea cynaroides]